MYDDILVAVDGSDHALRAATHAGALADTFDARLSLVTVVDPSTAAGPFSAGGIDEAYRDRLRATARETVTAAAAAVDYPTRTAVRLGRPSECILTYADEEESDLIAAGTRGQTGLRRHLLGSVAERLVRLASVPVLAARAIEDAPVADYDAILVPTDHSAAAAAATDHALSIADRTGAHVHAVTVVDARSDVPTPPSDRTAGAKTATEEVTDRARDLGLDATGTVLEGRPASTLVEYATDHAVDLIAMGRTGRGGLSRALLGSTTDRVLRRADAPVLTVGAESESS